MSVLNPSINDYLNAEISSNIIEQINIIENSVYIEQVLKVVGSDESIQALVNLLVSGNLLKMECLYNSPFYYFVKIIIDYKIYDARLKTPFQFSLERLYVAVIEIDDYSVLISKLMSDDFIRFYEIEQILLDPNVMFFLIKPIEYELLKKITDCYTNLFNSSDHKKEYGAVLDAFHDSIVDKLSVVAESKVKDDLYSKISNLILKFADDEGILHENELKRELEFESIDVIENYIHNEITIFNPEMKIKPQDFHLKDIILNINFQEEIDFVQQEQNTDYEDESYKFDNPYDEISNMFER